MTQPLGANDVSDVAITEEQAALDYAINELEGWIASLTESLKMPDFGIALADHAKFLEDSRAELEIRKRHLPVLLRLRHRAQAGWQPIESAPRDSSKVLVGHFDIWGEWTTKMAWWRLPYEAAPAKSCWWCYDGDKTLLSADVHFSPEGKRLGATHWKPLPPPPKVTP